MEQLPSEILGEIFLYLHPQNKVECMLVCQHWKQVIERFALYQALDIRSVSNLFKLTKIVKENPEIGKKVEHLMFYFQDEIDDFDLSEFLLLLPNIRTILCSSPEWIDLITSKKIIYPWSQSIKCINEYSTKSITNSLFLSNTCPHLTTIDVIDSHVKLIPFLKNAPVLRSLTLTTGSISFDDLDIIHANAPCLRSFITRGLTLSNSELSHNINPVPLVTECVFDNLVVTSINLEARLKLLVYVSKKYPNLSKFTYTLATGYSDIDHINKLTNSEWFPLVQNLGPRLKELCLCDHGWADSMFDILDRSNCQLDYLKVYRLSDTVFTKIVESQQIFSIQTLALHDIHFETYSWLNEFKALKKLKLYFSSYENRNADFGLDTILSNSQPTLRSLLLFRVHLAADPKFDGVSNVEFLSFNRMIIPKGTDSFITQCFPKLCNLKLNRCNVAGNEFNLEKMSLLNFSYTSRFSNNGVFGLLIITSGNNERRWYSVKGGGYGSYGIDSRYITFHPPVKSWLQSETDTNPYFTLLCNTLNNCTFI